MPSTQKVHIDKVLAEISIGYKNEMFIGDQIFKSIPVDKRSDYYYVFGEEIFEYVDDKIAPRSIANEIDWTLSEDTFMCHGHALRHGIADEEIGNSDVFDLEKEGAELVTDKILLNKERDIASKVLDSSNYDPALVLSPTKWSDFTNSDPIFDIRKAKEAIHLKSGIRPNTLVISETVANILAVHPKLLAIYKNTEIGVISLDMMKIFLDVDQIIVGKALAKPKGGEKAYVWGNSAALLYVPERPSKKQVAFGYSFEWNYNGKESTRVKKYYEDASETTYLEVKRYYVHKVVSKLAGVLFPDVVDPITTL